MDTIKINKRGTVLIAHRGLSGIETENTNAAFVAAGNRTYYGIETDIYKTADGRFVVHHDNHLGRLSGEDVGIENTAFSVLREIVLFDKDGGKDREDLRVPTLENYISICKRYCKHCVLELKSQFSAEETERMIDIIEGHHYLANTTFISFHYKNLLKIRQLLPAQSVQFLFSSFKDVLIRKLVADRMDVDVRYDALDKKTIDALHANGLRINCWTVDDKETAERLTEWGVDYITTNILE